MSCFRKSGQVIYEVDNCTAMMLLAGLTQTSYGGVQWNMNGYEYMNGQFSQKAIFTECARIIRLISK